MIHARYIKITPTEYINYKSMRCDVYVSGKLNNTPERIVDITAVFIIMMQKELDMHALDWFAPSVGQQRTHLLVTIM